MMSRLIYEVGCISPLNSSLTPPFFFSQESDPRVLFTEKDTAEVAEEQAREWLKMVLSRPAPAFASCKVYCPFPFPLEYQI